MWLRRIPAELLRKSQKSNKQPMFARFLNMFEVGRHVMINTQSIKLGLTCKGNYSKGIQLSKQNYVERVCQDNRPRGLSKKVIKDIVDETFMFILQSIQKDSKFTYPGFGSFRLKIRKQRQGTNPNTGEKITIASRKAISFTVSGKLKKTLR